MNISRHDKKENGWFMIWMGSVMLLLYEAIIVLSVSLYIAYPFCYYYC